MVDYHIHTVRCGHASGEVAEYVRRAQELSLAEIGFADHLPLVIGMKDPTLAMRHEELDDYIAEIEALKTQFPGIIIKTGIEADYFPGYEQATRDLLSRYPFDYVIGSVHFIEGWGFDDSRYIDGYKTRDIFDIYKAYYELLEAAARTGLFDIIGHIDLVKKYGFVPEQDVTTLVGKALGAIHDAGMCVEINTAGLRKPVGEIYPGSEILKRCFENGIPITFGSDAHAPGEVGMAFERACAVAGQAGYDMFATFAGRVRSFKALARK
jgi:histidinol-phosphatase (PHP family)